MGMQTVSKNNLRFNKNYNKFKFYKKNNIYCSRQKLTNTINTKSINRSIINYSTFSKKDRYAKYKTPFLFFYFSVRFILFYFILFFVFFCFYLFLAIFFFF